MSGFNDRLLAEFKDARTIIIAQGCSNTSNDFICDFSGNSPTGETPKVIVAVVRGTVFNSGSDRWDQEECVSAG